MRRKVIKQGNNTLTITLPRKWTEKFDIKAGDEIDLDERSHSLVIHGVNQELSKNIVVEVPKGIRFSRRFIFMPYCNGYDEIKVVFYDKDIMHKINQHIFYMMGFEIVAQGEHYCVLKNIAKGIEGEFDSLFNRMMHLCGDMVESIHDALQSGEYDRLVNIKEMENLANKLNLFSRRMLNKKGHSDPKKATSLYRLNCLYEEVTDYLKDICEIILEKKLTVDKKSVGLFKDLSEILALGYSIYNKLDLRKCESYHFKEIAFKEKINAMLIKSDKKNVLLLNSLSKIEECLHNMIEELF